jgi:putative ABC transport system permease protein
VRLELDGITLQADQVASVEAIAGRLRNFLSRTHQDADYEMMVPLELIQSAAESQRIFSVVMASIAAISLLVGGIGIMNIMLANVAERRKEIGTRRALGARRIDIIGQFLIESVTLTGLGGLSGVALGYGLSEAVGRYAGWPVYVTPLSVILGMVVSCGVGVVFGLWPAYQAAKVRPIEALRSE